MKSATTSLVEHPGVYIREELEERGWTQRDLAYILGRPEQSINTILSGKRGITAEMAKALGEAFDVSAEFFLNLQKMYDLAHAQEPDSGIIKRARFFQSSYPVREMLKRGWIDDTEDPALLEAQMTRFFEVDDVTKIPHLSHAAKKSVYEDVPPNQLAWLFRVKHMAKSIHVPKYSEKRLREKLPRLRSLMREPEEARHVPRLLMDCGIRYIIVEILPASKIDGVCFWLGDDAPVIGMSLRFDRIDNFWFVLRHEIEHVLRKHGREREIIDAELEGDRAASEGDLTVEERIANKEAADFCIPEGKLDSLYAQKSPYISERDVTGFASSLNIHPGIVVGQLHNKTKDFRFLRKYLVKVGRHLLPSAVADGWGEVAAVNL